MLNEDFECSDEQLLGRLVDLSLERDRLLSTRQAPMEALEAIEYEQNVLRSYYHRGLNASQE